MLWVCIYFSLFIIKLFAKQKDYAPPHQIESICIRQINVAKKPISLFDREENNVGKGENAGYQHFLIFPLCFQKASFLGIKVAIVW